MLGRVLQLLGLRSARSRAAPADLQTVDRELVSHLIRTEHGLPHVDWGAADVWSGAVSPTPPSTTVCAARSWRAGSTCCATR